MDAREAWILRLTDDDGRIGLGEAVLEPDDGEVGGDRARGAGARGGRDGAASGRLPTGDELEAHGRPGRALRAALDARAARPRRGAGRRRCRADGDGVGRQRDDRRCSGPRPSAEAARQAVAAGFTTLKLKAGAERETEVLVDRVRAVRTAVGPDVRLRLDVNGAWDLETADGAARGGRAVRARVRGAAAGRRRRRRRWPSSGAGSASRSRPTRPSTPLRAARELLDAGAVDVLVVKPARVGGPVAARRSRRSRPSAACRSSSAPCSRPAWGSRRRSRWRRRCRTARLAGRRRRDHGLATAGCSSTTCCVDELVVEDGRMRLPDGAAGRAGSGSRSTSDALARYRAESRGGRAGDATVAWPGPRCDEAAMRRAASTADGRHLGRARRRHAMARRRAGGVVGGRSRGVAASVDRSTVAALLGDPARRRRGGAASRRADAARASRRARRAGAVARPARRGAVPADATTPVRRRPDPRRRPAVVVLTSGTTGAAEGRRAARRGAGRERRLRGSRRCRRRPAGCSRWASGTSPASGSCGGRSRGRVPVRIVARADPAALLAALARRARR